MARRQRLSCEWSLAGYWRRGFDWERLCGREDVPPVRAHVPGSVADDLCRAGFAAGYLAGDTRAMEWLAGRVWVYSTQFEMPEEPEDGASEKAFICLDGSDGLACAALNGQRLDVRDGRADITGIAAGSHINRLAVAYDYGDQPGPAPDASGDVYIPNIGLLYGAELRLVSFARISSVTCDIVADRSPQINVGMLILADVRGRYALKLRAVTGQGEYVASSDIGLSLIAAGQQVQCAVALPDGFLSGAPTALSVHIILERQGIRCDSAESDAVYSPPARGHVAALYPVAPYFTCDMREQYEALADIARGMGAGTVAATGDMPRWIAAVCADKGLRCEQARAAPPQGSQPRKTPPQFARVMERAADVAGQRRRGAVTFELNQRRPVMCPQGTDIRPGIGLAAVAPQLMPAAVFIEPASACFTSGRKAVIRLSACYPGMDGAPAVLQTDVRAIAGNELFAGGATYVLNGDSTTFDPIEIDAPWGSGAMIVRARLWTGDDLLAARTVSALYAGGGDAQAALGAIPAPSLRVYERDDCLWLENNGPVAAIGAYVRPKDASRCVLILPGLTALLPWEKTRLSFLGADAKNMTADDLEIVAVGVSDAVC